MIIIFQTSIRGLAQNTIGYRIQKNDVGINHNFYFSKTVKSKHAFEIGIRLHQNIYQPSPVINIYRDRFWARNAMEHTGISFGYKRNYKLNNFVRPFTFVDMQISRLSLRYNDRLIEYINSKFVTGNEFTFCDNPHFNIETNVGLGLEFKLNKHFSLVEKVGVGMALFFVKQPYYNPPTHKSSTKNGIAIEDWEFTKMLSFGVARKIK